MPDIFDKISGPGGFDQEDATRKGHAVARGELPKRFYKAAAHEPSDGGWRVVLDGRPVRTPARAVLAVLSEQVAVALAAEWNAQGERINPATMPLTRLVNVAIDAVGPAAGAVADEIASYAGTDAVAYRAEGPERLQAQQSAIWDPIVAHAESRLGIRVRLAIGVMPITQDEGLVTGLRAALPADPFVLAGLHTVTTLTGSALTALAVLDGVLSADEAFAAANVDEDWNIQFWGEDDEAVQRRAYRKQELDAAVLLIGGMSANV
jgi:chaperone required for assembly of F1-ATPase